MKLRNGFALLLILTLSGSSWAVFPAKVPLPKMYETSATVLVAKVSKLNPSNRLIDAEVLEAIKGDKPDKLRLQLVSPESLFGQIKEGDPIVVCTAKGRGAGDATVHLANTFLVARLKPEMTPPLWQIIQEQSNDFKKTFPGTTGSLIHALRELKDQKTTFLNSADDRHFTEGATEVAQLKITPTNLFVADLNGDGQREFLVCTPHGPRIFAKSGENYEDTTAKYSLPTSGRLLAIGDLNGDSKPDLLIDNTPWLLQGASFKAAAPLDFRPKLLAAIAIADGKVISVTQSGELSVGGQTRHLWPESQSPRAVIIGPFDEGNKTGVIVAFENSLSRFSLDGTRADFTRLTGESLSTYLKDSKGEFNPGLKLIPLDANGDGRSDLLVLSDGANFLLINRGFGAFFISPGAAQNALGSAPDKPFPYTAYAASSHWAAIDTRGDHHEDLLILTPDGALYRLGNPPPK
jgi:hypothetical protein